MISVPTVFTGVADLISRAHLLVDCSGWIYINLDQLDNGPMNYSFHIIPEEWIYTLSDDEIYLDRDGLEMPIRFRDLNLECWMVADDVAHLAAKVATTDDPCRAFIGLVERREASRPVWSRRPRRSVWTLGDD